MEVVCPYCGTTIIVNEINDGSPMRTYEYAICPKCKKIVHEDYIVGEFNSEIKEQD